MTSDQKSMLDMMRRIDDCLDDDETPRWGRVLLVAMRNVYGDFYRHIQWHDKRETWIVGISSPIIVAVLIGVVWAIIQLL